MASNTVTYTVDREKVIKVTLANQQEIAATLAAGEYDSSDAVMEAGKTAIAAALNNKGIPTSPSSTLARMANNINQIVTSDKGFVTFNGSYEQKVYNLNVEITATPRLE